MDIKLENEEKSTRIENLELELENNKDEHRNYANDLEGCIFIKIHAYAYIKMYLNNHHN